MTWTCKLCNKTFVVPSGRRVDLYVVAHMTADHRCANDRLGKRCVRVAPHRYRHHLYVSVSNN